MTVMVSPSARSLTFAVLDLVTVVSPLVVTLTLDPSASFTVMVSPSIELIVPEVKPPRAVPVPVPGPAPVPVPWPPKPP